jgi:tRNA dimethylallyltransferase
MDIGTAKPTAEERARVPHHVVDVADPDEAFSAGRFVALAGAAMHDIAHRGILPVVVGGTGMYIYSLIRGATFGGTPPNPAMRSVLAALSLDELQALGRATIGNLAPATWAKLDQANPVRIVRALERMLFTNRAAVEVAARHLGKRGREHAGFALLAADEWRREPALAAAPLALEAPGRWHHIHLTLPKDESARRIDKRTLWMYEAGLIDETRRLLDAGFSADLPALRTIGYGEAVAVIRGATSVDEAVAATAKRTRLLARRQRTWFRNQMPKPNVVIDSTDVGVAADLVIQAIEAALRQ